MSKSKRLAERISQQFLWIGVVLFIACMGITFVFVLYSIDTTTNRMMVLEARSIVNDAKKNPEISLPMEDDYSAFRTWEEIPVNIRNHLDKSNIEIDHPVDTVLISSEEPDPDHLIFLHHFDPEYGDLFLYGMYKSSEIEAITSLFLKDAIHRSFSFTLIVFVVLFAIISLIIRRSTAPFSLLAQWANSIKQNPSKIEDINFPVSELNEIAEHLKDSIKHVNAANERERQFLKHASHELRTPLAVIQASLDTLNLQTTDASKATVNRALRASAKMISLSDALLWLARESERPIQKNRVDIASLCGQLTKDHEYLLHDKDITIQIQGSAEPLMIEDALLSIVLANLIRNAFQYTADGDISIEAGANKVTISNPIFTSDIEPDSPSESIESRNNEPSFGLGLQLVERICEKLGWHFDLQLDASLATVTLQFDQTQ
ncbi:MAG: HAMP domain-containing histidine kinase [Pseudomonadales bacterium]|nr:HAMP domain-containing histidine kinase [Pseudomonadales bacterium]